MITIDCLTNGQAGTIVKLDGNNPLTRRLSALGCIPGTMLKLQRRAPLGDPLIIKVRGYSLAIRKKDASSIFVEV